MELRSDSLDNAYGLMDNLSVAKIAKSVIGNQLSKRMDMTKSYVFQVAVEPSGFGKDVIPRLGGLMDLQTISWTRSS